MLDKTHEVVNCSGEQLPRKERLQGEIMHQTKRNREMDIIKGLGIIFMVYGHANGPEHRFFYLFHMAIFVIVSGYFYKENYAQTATSVMAFIKKKLQGLYIPFIGFSLPFILLHNLFLTINVYTDNSDFLVRMNYNPFAALDHYRHAGGLAKEALASLFFMAQPQPGAALWFLRALFLLSLFHIFIDFLLQKIKLPSYRHYLLHALIALLLLLIGTTVEGARLHPVFFLAQACSMYWLFVFGRMVQGFRLTISPWRLMAVVLLTFCILLSLYHTVFIELAQNQFTSVPLFILASITGWCWVYALAALLNRQEVVAHMLALVGRYSLFILALHFLSFKCVNALQTLLFNCPSYMTAAFPTLCTEKGWWLIYTIAGIILPILGGKALQHLHTLLSAKFARSKTAS